MTNIPVTAPFDGSDISSVPNATQQDVENALATAHALYRNRDGWLSKPRRIEILKRAAEIIKERREELALEAAREGGKPLMDSLVEIDRAADGVENCVEVLRAEGGRVIPMSLNPSSTGRIAFTQFEPIGPVVAVSAFNHPFNLIVHQVTPAIAVGCPVIVKPADITPLSCFSFVNILYEAGLPKEWCQIVVPQDLDVATALVSDPRNAFFSFIGSARVGWMLRSKLAPGTRCALEHGGAAPVILAGDADLDDALERVIKGTYYQSGQSCISVQRILIHAAVYDQFRDMLVERARSLVVGDPKQRDTFIGPMIDEGEAERLKGWIDEAVANGATLLCGGGRDGQMIEATLLEDVDRAAKIVNEEAFGPVAVLMKFDDFDAALKEVNRSEFGLQAGIFTRDLFKVLDAWDRVECGGICINEVPSFRVDNMPYGGVKNSGLGREGVRFAMEDMTEIRSLVIRRT